MINYQNAKKKANKQTNKKNQKKEIRAQRTPTCFIIEGSFTFHIVVIWIKPHQTITLPAKNTPHAIIRVWFNFVRSMGPGAFGFQTSFRLLVNEKTDSQYNV